MTMPWTDFAQMGAKDQAAAWTGVTNWIGGDKAAKALKGAQGKARNSLTQGYDEARGFQQPIYDTALGNYQDLSGDVAGGKYDMARMDPYKFDPNSVFEDPEYQASMRAGTQALDASANAGSTLFSGAHQKDLQQFGQDTFAGRSDELYNRGFNANNTAFNQNLAGSGQNFNQGLALTNPLAGAAGNLTDLSVMQGGDMANLDLGSGVIRANNIMNTSNAIGGMGAAHNNNKADFFGSLGGNLGKKS